MITILNRLAPISYWLLALLLTGFLALEPALAGNKFATIGGGVTGDHGQKAEILKDLALIVGSFLILLGVLALVTKQRFEGLIGMYNQNKKYQMVILVPLILIVLGVVLVLISFI